MAALPDRRMQPMLSVDLAVLTSATSVTQSQWCTRSFNQSTTEDTSLGCAAHPSSYVVNQTDLVSSIDPQVLGHLRERVGLFHLRQRWTFEHRQGESARERNRKRAKEVLTLTLSLLRLAARGRRNALDLEVNHNRLAVLPPGSPLTGYRILHLSDLHIEGFPELVDAIVHAIAPLEYDLCLLTGDYAFLHNAVEGVVEGVEAVHAAVKTPAFAILGNHDSIRIVPPLERCGIRFLINESVAIGEGASSFRLAGVDDSVHYRASNLERAVGEESDPLTILMNHSPMEYREAAAAGIDVYLTGHTHGGQVCLPGGVPVVTNSTAPRRMTHGAWRHGAMQGYTSRGVGSSMVRVRFNCPPEIVVHELVSR